MKNKTILILVSIFITLSIIGSLLPVSNEEKFDEAQSDYQIGNFDEALTTINKLIRKDSSESKYYELRGKILYKLQDTKSSNDDFERTLSYASTDAEKDIRIRELIDWNIEQNREKAAKELLTEEINLYKSDSLKHINAVQYAATKYLSFGDTLEAILLYSKLSEEYPFNGGFNNQSGVLYSKMKKYRDAVNEFKKATEVEPNNDTYLYNLGIAYINLDNKSRAKPILKKAMDLGNRDACREYRELTAKIRYRKKSKCCDGSTSDTVGRGACSHHGGVCGIINVPYKVYTTNCF